MTLAKRGYDYFKLKEADTEEILDILEFEEIYDAILEIKLSNEE